MPWLLQQQPQLARQYEVLTGKVDRKEADLLNILFRIVITSFFRGRCIVCKSDLSKSPQKLPILPPAGIGCSPL